jgi:hypothetical protein
VHGPVLPMAETNKAMGSTEHFTRQSPERGPAGELCKPDLSCTHVAARAAPEIHTHRPARIFALLGQRGFQTVVLSKKVIVRESKNTFSLLTGPCRCFAITISSSPFGRPESSIGR